MRAKLMDNLPGEPLYPAGGYEVLERTGDTVGGVFVPLIRIGKRL